MHSKQNCTTEREKEKKEDTVVVNVREKLSQIVILV